MTCVFYKPIGIILKTPEAKFSVSRTLGQQRVFFKDSFFVYFEKLVNKLVERKLESIVSDFISVLKQQLNMIMEILINSGGYSFPFSQDTSLSYPKAEWNTNMVQASKYFL